MRRAPEPLDVIVRHTQAGVIYPLQFTRGSKTYQVRGVGRRWDDDTGMHILVMVEGGQVCELLHDPEGRWFILPRLGATFA